ncbi:hypothetical protein EUGRSUZ_C03066 [Eucalyptus grandis]|uniref:Uncharacterized protein n=2 Tax=Eucalyptus grandis TaxID=71139 RepID=A0ACC3LHZ3_EUCGR|nr:hypothetical protein EUGRSUZ_C03066 [Eucalyptus grandis]
MSLADLVLFRVDNSGSDHTRRVSDMDMSRLNLMANTSGSLSDSVMKDTTEVVSGEEDDSSCGDLDNEVRIVAVSVPGEEKGNEIPLLDMMTDDKTDWMATGDVIAQESEDDSLSLEGDRFLDSSCSLSVTSETSSLCAEDFLIVDANSEIETPRCLDVEKSVCSVNILAKAPEVEEVNVEREMTNGPLSVAVSLEEDVRSSLSSQSSAVVVQLPQGKQVNATVGRSVFEVEYVPLWGFTSLCGRRPEMEDAVRIVPQFLKIPIQMLVGGPALDGISDYVSEQTAHFFGVYDGHGGLQVDAEVSGKFSTEPVAPETVGSTAVVAMICSSHIVVANCGDSRAVLYRGKEPIALSVDHKPNREDEYARIEAAGGKVIQWNGHRVFGVLAMSRSIGDRYLKPWIIPEPEVVFVPRTREDECLVLASDGLWDVMTNEEACDLARKRLLLWHKKNGVTHLPNKGEVVDPAAQAAAEYLSKCALQKGSKDNITVIVVDLKAQRKFKSKT